jgi:tetratricopeptide (TPR) repeat protein
MTGKPGDRTVGGIRFRAPALLLLALFASGTAVAQPDETTLRHLRALPAEPAIAELDSFSTDEALDYALALFEYALQRGDPSAAEQFVEAAIGIARRADDAQTLSEVLSTRAFLEQTRGDVAGAIDTMTEVAQLTEAAGLTGELIMALRFLGNLQHRYGVLAQALATTQRLLAYESEMDNPLLLAHILNEAAMLNYKLGHLDEVPPYLERALPVFQELNDEDGIGTVYRIYGNYHNSLGQPETALDYYQRARVHYVNTNNVHDYANISYNIGLILLQAGTPAGALPHLKNAVENFTTARSVSGAGMAGSELARALFQLRRYEDAERVMAQARRHLESSQSFFRLAQAHVMYGGILFTRGDKDAALAAYGEALRLYRRLGMSADEQRTLETMIRIRRGTQGEIEL